MLSLEILKVDFQCETILPGQDKEFSAADLMMMGDSIV
jgi:hypothetical protein